MSLRRFVRLTHGWIGVVLGLFIVLVAGTGASLAFMSEMFLAQYGEVLEASAPSPRASPVGIDEMFASARAERGEAFQAAGVLMPHTRVPKVSTALVYGMEDGGDPDYPMMVSVDPWTGEAKGAFSLGDAFGHDMIDFHYELTFGSVGATFVSVLGLLLVLFAISGIWLWWPRRGHVWRKARSPALRGGASDKLFQLHGWLGIWTALLVVVFALSGSALTRPDWFGPLLADMHAQEPHGGAWSRDCGTSKTFGDAAREASALVPGKQISAIYIMPGEPYHVYLRGSGDLNRIEGDSLVWVHPSCAGTTKIIDASTQPVPERLGGMMLSLHGGYLFGPFLGSVLVLLTGLSLVFFTISGVVVFFTRTWRGKPLGKSTVPREVRAAE